MEIPKKTWSRFTETLRAISKKAGSLFTEYLETHDISTPEGMQRALEYAYGLSMEYGEGTAALACEMHEAVAEASGRKIQPAEPAEMPTFREVAMAVRGKMMDSKRPDVIGTSVERLVKRTGVDTSINNALRDGAEFAWIPSGDSCAFCLMLASNGWQRASKKAIKNGHAVHVHANCDCTYAIRFDGHSTVEGYDPDALREQYDNAEGANWKEKMNSMRRAQYAENKDEINAQKRAAYARRNTHFLRKKTETSWEGVPQNHTESEIEGLKKYASEKGLILDPSFTSFDGDLELIKDFIDTTNNNIDGVAFKRNKGVRIGVSYTMADDTYAVTDKATITLNGFAYRDRALLEADYKERMEVGFFTKGSTYLDIATHESAHVIIYMNQLKVNGARKRFFGNHPFEAVKKISAKISTYATETDEELIAEAYTLFRNGSRNINVLNILKYCGIL